MLCLFTCREILEIPQSSEQDRPIDKADQHIHCRESINWWSNLQHAANSHREWYKKKATHNQNTCFNELIFQVLLTKFFLCVHFCFEKVQIPFSETNWSNPWCSTSRKMVKWNPSHCSSRTAAMQTKSTPTDRHHCSSLRETIALTWYRNLSDAVQMHSI